MATTQNLTGLMAGAYILEVVDANGCSSIINVTISEPSPIVIEIDQGGTTDVSCEGTNDGAISINGIGGISPFIYSLDGGSITAEPLFENLSAGTYLIDVVDANSCSSIINVTISEPSPIVIDIDQGGIMNASCFCLLYTSPSPRDRTRSRMPSSA